MSNYQSGRAFEYLAAKELETEGYKIVRSAGSHSMFDLVAWDAYNFRLIQIKKLKRKRAFGKEARQFKAMPVPPGTTKELWIRHKGVWHKTKM